MIALLKHCLNIALGGGSTQDRGNCNCPSPSWSTQPHSPGAEAPRPKSGKPNRSPKASISSSPRRCELPTQHQSDSTAACSRVQAGLWGRAVARTKEAETNTYTALSARSGLGHWLSCSFAANPWAVTVRLERLPMGLPKEAPRAPDIGGVEAPQASDGERRGCVFHKGTASSTRHLLRQLAVISEAKKNSFSCPPIAFHIDP